MPTSARAAPRAWCSSCARSTSEEQHAALQLRARLRGLELPLETWQWLQRRLPRDMRTLYQVLDTLDEASLAAQRRLTVPFIREVLGAAAPDGATEVALSEAHSQRRDSCTASSATRRPRACAPGTFPPRW